MATKQTQAPNTDVYHDGTEQAVRSRSQHSRSAHVPATDDDGNIVFDGDGRPEPKCDVDQDPDTEWVLRAVTAVANRDTCTRCFDEDAVKEQNAANGASPSFARKMRYGDDWGSEA